MLNKIVKLVLEYYEVMYGYCPTEQKIAEDAEGWTQEIINAGFLPDAYVIAACVIHYGKPCHTTYSEQMQLKNYYFHQ